MMQTHRKLTGAILLATSLVLSGFPLAAAAETARSAAGDNAFFENLSLYKELAPAEQSAALTYYRGQFPQFGSPSPTRSPVQRSCSRVLGPG